MCVREDRRAATASHLSASNAETGPATACSALIAANVSVAAACSASVQHRKERQRIRKERQRFRLKKACLSVRSDLSHPGRRTS